MKEAIELFLSVSIGFIVSYLISLNKEYQKERDIVDLKEELKWWKECADFHFKISENRKIFINKLKDRLDIIEKNY